MQFNSFSWLSHHGLWASIPRSTNLVNVSGISLDVFIFIKLSFYPLGAFLTEQLFHSRLLQMKWLKPSRRYTPRKLSIIWYTTSTRGITVHYFQTYLSYFNHARVHLITASLGWSIYLLCSGEFNFQLRKLNHVENWALIWRNDDDRKCLGILFIPSRTTKVVLNRARLWLLLWQTKVRLIKTLLLMLTLQRKLIKKQSR